MDKKTVLTERAKIINKIREFFADRDYLEVETPVFQSGANLDHGVVPFFSSAADKYLVTSPEHHMKRLLSSGFDAIWTISKSFRKFDLGKTHEPEFSMLEWYNTNLDLSLLKKETIALIEFVLGKQLSVTEYSYRDVFIKTIGLDPFLATDEELFEVLKEHGAEDFTRDEKLDLIMAEKIEPSLDRGIVVISDFPANRAAQAEVTEDEHGNKVAKRFEIYLDNLELANAYRECTDYRKILSRFENENKQFSYKIDEKYIEALKKGMPSASGIALGIDRLIMIVLGLRTIAETKAFSWLDN